MSTTGPLITVLQGTSDLIQTNKTYTKLHRCNCVYGESPHQNSPVKMVSSSCLLAVRNSLKSKLKWWCIAAIQKAYQGLLNVCRAPLLSAPSLRGGSYYNPNPRWHARSTTLCSVQHWREAQSVCAFIYCSYLFSQLFIVWGVRIGAIHYATGAESLTCIALEEASYSNTAAANLYINTPN